MPKIFDGTFYSIEKRINEKIDARCLECSDVRKGSITSTGNFKNHYKTMHCGRFEALEEYLKSSNTQNVTTKVRQPTMPQIFTPTVSPEKVSIQKIFHFNFQVICSCFYFYSSRNHLQVKS